MTAKSSLPEYDGRRSPNRVSNVWRARYTAALDFLEELQERGTARVDNEYRSHAAERQKVVENVSNKLVAAGHCTEPLQGAVNVVSGHGKHISHVLNHEALLCELAGVEAHYPDAVDWLRTVDLEEVDPDALYQNGIRVAKGLEPALAARRTALPRRFFLAVQMLETLPQDARAFLLESGGGGVFSYDKLLPLRALSGEDLLAAIRLNFGEPTAEDLHAYAAEIEETEQELELELEDGDVPPDELAATTLKLLFAIAETQQRMERKLDFLARELGYKEDA